MKSRILDQKELTNILEGNTSYFILRGEGECSLVLMQRGGRLIGAFPKEGSKNALWTNPQLESILNTEEWNVGGDRLWISPERDFFYRNAERFEQWFCPSALDPGNYELAYSSRDAVAFRNVFDLSNMRTGETYKDVCVTRTMSYLPNPYASDPRLEKALESVSYVGIKSVEEVLVKENYDRLRINPWIITQVNPESPKNRGMAIVPTKGADVQPIHYFGKIPDERLKVFGDHVSFKIDGEVVYKLGIRPEDLPLEREASIGYIADIEEANRESLLLIRRSKNAPRNQSECLDVAKANPNGLRGSIQSYNSGLELQLGEVELQLSPIERRDKGYYQRAIADLLIFQGLRNKIVEIAKILLNVSSI
jgi:hypothetical protein